MPKRPERASETSLSSLHNGRPFGERWTSPYLHGWLRLRTVGATGTCNRRCPAWAVLADRAWKVLSSYSWPSEIDSSARTAFESPSIALPTLFRNSTYRAIARAFAWAYTSLLGSGR